jgi:hypothetical protein
MKQLLTLLVTAMACSAATVRAEISPPRPELDAVKPIASCQLQTLASDSNVNNMPEQLIVYSLQAPPDDPLANYERTPLGDWYKPAASGRDDPWLRFLLITPDRPLVVDLAVFIDGKPFRNAREAWIDDVFAAAKPVAAAKLPLDKLGTEQAAGGADAEVEVEAGNKESAAEGTNTTSEASKSAAPPAETADSNASDETEAKAGEKAGLNDTASSGEEKPESKNDEGAKAKSDKPDTPVVPGVKAQYRQAPTMRDRLINYLTAAGAAVDRDEIEWLIAEWGSGPAVVVLGASQSWQRASVAPLLTCLDQNADGGLSAEEIGRAESLLKRADMDGDDVVELSEIRRATKHASAAMKSAGYPLIVLIDANTDWEAVAADLARVYECKAEAFPSDTREFEGMPADMTMRVDFDANTGEKKNGSAVTAVSVSPSIATAEKAVSATSDVIAVDLGGDYVEFAAAQTAGDKNTDISGSQLAIGAVIDGNPLLRLLDGDEDGRLTLRERQQLSGLLAALDRDADGQVSAGEVPVPIRLAVTLGPRVHQLLARPTGAARTIAPQEVSKAPEWFASMDKNGDGDLSRGEFLGTTEQFRQFDENGDQLLGVAEALKLNPGE